MYTADVTNWRIFFQLGFQTGRVERPRIPFTELNRNTESNKEKEFNASKGHPATVKFRTDDSNNTDVDLMVKGIPVGTIDELEGGMLGFEQFHSFLMNEDLRTVTLQSARVGDEVWVLHGASKPVLLRFEGETSDGLNSYGFLGEVFVCDIEKDCLSDVMFGRMVEMAGQGLKGVVTRQFWIV